MSHANDNAAIYTQYFDKRPANRDDLLTNKQVIWQELAHRYSKIKALQHITLDRTSCNVLDVGCGYGTSLMLYLELGFLQNNLIGIDIWEEQIQTGKKTYSLLDLRCQDASEMQFADATFDLVTESTMLLQITDDELAQAISSEMIRVLKPGGHLILSDWRYGKPGSKEFNAVNKKRLSKLFDCGSKTQFVKQYRGGLVPPLGRFLSQYAPALYMPIYFVFPFMTGLVTTVLRKI